MNIQFNSKKVANADIINAINTDKKEIKVLSIYLYPEFEHLLGNLDFENSIVILANEFFKNTKYDVVSFLNVE